MKKVLIIFLYVCVSLNIAGQENYVFENRFRNPVDTMTFHTRPTLLLFVHSTCGHGHLCATTRIQKALEEDSLKIRKERGIKLYVVYPKCYDKNDINTFDTFNPVNAEVVFYTDAKYKGSFSEGNETPFVVLYDEKEYVHKRQVGTYKDLADWIDIYIHRLCQFCKGSGRYISQNPDFWLNKCHGEPCPICNGKGYIK
ncbi:MAG: hypothetical protein ACI4BH_05305 [Muribaculaceae bacterium]